MGTVKKSDYNDSDNVTLALLVERFEETRNQLEELTSTVNGFRSNLETLNINDKLDEANDNHTKEIIDTALEGIVSDIKELKENQDTMKNTLDLIKQELPFLKLLKSWAKYVALLFIALFAVSVWQLVVNFEAKTNSSAVQKLDTKPDVRDFTKPGAVE